LEETHHRQDTRPFADRQTLWHHRQVSTLSHVAKIPRENGGQRLRYWVSEQRFGLPRQRPGRLWS
ncbi:hypothetical protein CI238_09595, partial [Colletotrichum incanum]